MIHPIIIAVMRSSNISEEMFFGPRRWKELVAARVQAIHDLTASGLSQAAIARAMRRDHATVNYWQKAKTREKRSAYYKVYHGARRILKGCPPCIVEKTTEEQRRQLLDLHAAGRKAEMRELQKDIGVGVDYTRRLAGRRRGKLPRAERVKQENIAKLKQPRPSPVLVRPQRVVALEPTPRELAHAAMMEDARRREMAPRSVTALLFGDPPPGFSALDRRETRA
ncbi:dnaA protein helix-turn-helix [Bradyrhizobium sp. NFR13]|uniref:hypothetical protein n=1 Tax=Bradyrhizobium sp. NFR13 TaxID=1566285 RepID=UPI0008F0B7E7|nr:hypothetical protein [Bradyrhizobium sp. NFR13]SFM00141.1 dnaA protein helix-turn-helix [Bradyrhizobium sp. NFR13]